MENVTGQSGKYYNEITIARGIGILLVVLGHAMKQTGVTNSVVSVLDQVIYSFHMPLFFVLSGFVSVKILRYSKVEERVGYIKNRAVRLLIPYFVIGILYMPLKYFLSRFARNSYDFSSAWMLIFGENPNTTMWFLYTLFWVSVITVVFVRKRILLPVLASSAVLSALAFYFDWGIRIPEYLFFFILGIYLREHYESFLKLEKNNLYITAMALLFLGGNVLLYFSLNIAGFVTSVAGTALCVLLSTYMNGRGKGGTYSLLSNLGGSSMDIYILSDPIQTVIRLIFWNILHVPNVLVIIVCFLFGVGGSAVLARYIIRRFRIFRILLFGEV